MKINVIELKKERRIEYDFLETFSDINLGGDNVKFTEPVNLKVSAEVIGKEITIVGKIYAELELKCSRCLELFHKNIIINFSEIFTDDEEHFKKFEDTDEEINFFTGEEIELNDFVIENIIVSLPIKRLCLQDCKGLCPQCGTNLNKEKCDCEPDDIDPRLAKLKDFLKK